MGERPLEPEPCLWNGWALMRPHGEYNRIRNARQQYWAAAPLTTVRGGGERRRKRRKGGRLGHQPSSPEVRIYLITRK